MMWFWIGLVACAVVFWGGYVWRMKALVELLPIQQVRAGRPIVKGRAIMNSEEETRQTHKIYVKYENRRWLGVALMCAAGTATAFLCLYRFNGWI